MIYDIFNQDWIFRHQVSLEDWLVANWTHWA